MPRIIESSQRLAECFIESVAFAQLVEHLLSGFEKSGSRQRFLQKTEDACQRKLGADMYVPEKSRETLHLELTREANWLQEIQEATLKDVSDELLDDAFMECVRQSLHNFLTESSRPESNAVPAHSSGIHHGRSHIANGIFPVESIQSHSLSPTVSPADQRRMSIGSMLQAPAPAAAGLHAMPNGASVVYGSSTNVTPVRRVLNGAAIPAQERQHHPSHITSRTQQY